MNRTIVMLLSLCSMLVFGSARVINAQTPGEPPLKETTLQLSDDLHFAVGLRLWFNTWEDQKFITEVPVPNQGTVGSGTGAVLTGFTGNAIGYLPTLGVRYKNFFVSASGMFANGYNFDGHPLGADFNFSGNRQEVDVNFGYYIHPMLAVSIGYKGIFQKLNTPAPLTGVFTSELKWSSNGIVSGLSANVPLPEEGLLPSGFSLYGTGGGGYVWQSYPSGTPFLDPFLDLGNHGFYGVMEGGIAYKPGQWPVVFLAGYKYQLVVNEFNTRVKNLLQKKNNSRDITNGWVIGLSLTF
jgi:hypothetical protein